MSSRRSDGRLPRVWLGVSIAVALAVAGCATGSGAYKAALAAEQIDDYDTAVVE